MTTKHLRIAAIIAVLSQFGAGGLASGAPPSKGVEIGTKFPDHFPVIRNFYLGKPVIGFGSDIGRVEQVPVIFLHGNNDTPFATACNPFGRIQAFAQFFLDHGYRLSELWGLGYQGDQCDLVQDNTHRSGISHTTAAAVPILREFVQAVLDFTGAKRVDIVAHSLGVTVAREWMLQDNAYRKVRALVAIDGPNHGIIDCSPSPANFYQLPSGGGFTPSSAVCDEYGSDHTQLLTVLNAAGETPGPTRYLSREHPTSSTTAWRTASSPAFPPRIATATRMISPPAPVSLPLRQSTLSARANSTRSSPPPISGS